jgi:hypothetical protein
MSRRQSESCERDPLSDALIYFNFEYHFLFYNAVYFRMNHVFCIVLLHGSE